MNNTYLIVNLVLVVSIIIAVFVLRKKYPDNYFAAGILCLLAPAIGQFYLKTKNSYKFWMLFFAIGRGVENASPNSYMPWLVVGAISAATICFRISRLKNISNSSLTDSYDKNYSDKSSDMDNGAEIKPERDLA